MVIPVAMPKLLENVEFKGVYIKKLISSFLPPPTIDSVSADVHRQDRARIIHLEESESRLHAECHKLKEIADIAQHQTCLLYTSPSPRDATLSRMPSSA